MKNIKGEGRGLKKEGAYSLSSPEKEGELIRGRGLFERGSLIEDLR